MGWSNQLPTNLTIQSSDWCHLTAKHQIEPRLLTILRSPIVGSDSLDVFRPACPPYLPPPLFLLDTICPAVWFLQSCVDQGWTDFCRVHVPAVPTCLYSTWNPQPSIRITLSCSWHWTTVPRSQYRTAPCTSDMYSVPKHARSYCTVCNAPRSCLLRRQSVPSRPDCRIKIRPRSKMYHITGILNILSNRITKEGRAPFAVPAY